MSEHLPQTNYLDPGILQRLGDLELVAREVVEGLRVGHHRSPLRGFSTEFAHHRQYAPGDAIRDIDWRVFGAYMEALKAGCVANQVDYTAIDTSRPLDAVLAEFFHQRQSTLNGPSAARS